MEDQSEKDKPLILTSDPLLNPGFLRINPHSAASMKSLVVLLTFLSVCSSKRYFSSLKGDCIPSVPIKTGFALFPEEFQLEGDTFADGVQIEVADDFAVTYRDSFKIAKNLRTNETYVLYQCGTDPPNVSSSPDAKVFEIPLTYVSLVDVTSSAFFAELGVSDRVQFASGYVTDACLQNMPHECGRVAQLLDSEFSDQKKLRIQNRRSDAIFVSYASNNTKSVAFTATSDPSVLKRAEWVKFVALFFNLEIEANRFFDQISKTWKDLKIKEGRNASTVAWISFQNFDGDEFFLHSAEYKLEYISSAGGKALSRAKLENMTGVTPTFGGFLIEFTDKTRSKAVSTLHDILNDVDVVIDETYQPNNTAYGIEEFYSTFGFTEKKRDFGFIKNKKVFRVDGKIGYAVDGSDSLDWYETAVARPDLVLKDLQLAIGTAEHKKHERIWLRNIAGGEIPKIVSFADCESFSVCYAKPEVICPAVRLTCDGELEYRNLTEGCLPSTCD